MAATPELQVLLGHRLRLSEGSGYQQQQEIGKTEWLGMLETANRLVEDLEEPTTPRARLRDHFHEDDWDEESAKDEAFEALRDGKPLYSLPERLRSDKEIVLAAIASEGSFCYNYIASRELRERDRDVILALVAADGSLLEMVSEKLRADRQVVLTALRTCAGRQSIETTGSREPQAGAKTHERDCSQSVWAWSGKVYGKVRCTHDCCRS